MGYRPANATEEIETLIDLTLVVKVYELLQKYSYMIYNAAKIDEDFKDILIEFLEEYKKLCQTHQH